MDLFKEALEGFLSKERFGRCDFHTHTFFSDGVLLPMEQLRRAHVLGHECYAITDHVSASNLDIIPKIARDCALAIKHWGMVALPGVELTHVPPESIAELAVQARELGALVIVVHGETTVEPVEPGTNLAAATNSNIDILAHPGLLTPEEASLCAKNNVFVELTSRVGHSLANGHVLTVGRAANLSFLQNTDTHSPGDMLDYSRGAAILRAAGMTDQEVTATLQGNIRKFLTKILARL